MLWMANTPIIKSVIAMTAVEANESHAFRAKLTKPSLSTRSNPCQLIVRLRSLQVAAPHPFDRSRGPFQDSHPEPVEGSLDLHVFEPAGHNVLADPLIRDNPAMLHRNHPALELVNDLLIVGGQQHGGAAPIDPLQKLNDFRCG